MSYTEQIIKISIEGVATKIETVLNIISTSTIPRRKDITRI